MSSKDGNELFAAIQASNQAAQASPAEGKLSGHRRERFEGDDASHLSGNASSNDVETGIKEPAHPAKVGFDPKNGTASVRTAHLFRTVIPTDVRRDGKENYPIAVGFCTRGCGVHCNQNPLPRECTQNPSVKFQNNQMAVTYVFTSPSE